ncbi:MAG: GNAT family N-acetyltransferase [Bacteroidetes bacterium]|nr:GNAT family N-acetyltransferase [Bacteroidota bacterium]
MNQNKYRFIADPDQIRPEAWDEFVEQHSMGNFFQTRFGMRFFLPKGRAVCLFVLSTEDEILGLIVGYVEEFGPAFLRKFLSRVVVIGGPLVRDNDPGILENLLREFLITAGKGHIYIEIRNLHDLSHRGIFHSCGYAFKPHYNVINCLEATEEEIFHSFSPSRRKGIRKAEKAGFTVSVSHHLSVEEVILFHGLIKEFHRGVNIPYPRRQFLEQANLPLFEGHLLYFLLHDAQGNIRAILLSTIFRKTLYGYIIGYSTDIDFIHSKPFDYLYWQVFRQSKELGYDYFDWMGAGSPGKDYGVRDFKLQFGGKLTEPGRFTAIINPLMYRLFLGILVPFSKWITGLRFIKKGNGS